MGLRKPITIKTTLKSSINASFTRRRNGKKEINKQF
jgi:hypothetical protein